MPDEKFLVNDWAFKGIIINGDKDINPIIVWADGSREELLRFWLNEEQQPSLPKQTEKKFESRPRRSYNN